MKATDVTLVHMEEVDVYFMDGVRDSNSKLGANSRILSFGAKSLFPLIFFLLHNRGYDKHDFEKFVKNFGFQPSFLPLNIWVYCLDQSSMHIN